LVSFGIGPGAGRNSLEIAAVSESIRLIGISFAE
jgi:hypothetical protein